MHKVSLDQTESKEVGSNNNFDDELRVMKSPKNGLESKGALPVPRQLAMEHTSTPGRNSVQHGRRKSDEIAADNFKLRLTLTESSPGYRKRSNSVTVKSEGQSFNSMVRPDSNNKCGILCEHSLSPDCFTYREVNFNFLS